MHLGRRFLNTAEAEAQTLAFASVSDIRTPFIDRIACLLPVPGVR
jgi:hypothetical protein